MNFSHFPQANSVLKAAPGTESYVQDLHIFRQLPYVVSCVDFDTHEVAAILASGRVFLQIEGTAATSPQAYGQCLLRFALAGTFALVQEAECLLTEFEGANEGPLLFMQPLPGQQLPQDSHPCAVACFALTDADQDALSNTGKLYVKSNSDTHPPICVHASNPISFSAPVPEQAVADAAQSLGIAEQEVPGFTDAVTKALTNLKGQNN